MMLQRTRVSLSVGTRCGVIAALLGWSIWCVAQEAPTGRLSPEVLRSSTSSQQSGQSQADQGGAWGSGGIELIPGPSPAAQPAPQSSGCTNQYLETQMSRADLAMGENNLQRWSRVMADTINRGCSGIEIDERIAKAGTLNATQTSARDAAMASAAKAGRPNLKRQPSGSVRTLGPSNQDDTNSWAAVADMLTTLASEYQASRSGATTSPAPNPRATASNSAQSGKTTLSVQDVMDGAVTKRVEGVGRDLDELMEDQVLIAEDTGGENDAATTSSAEDFTPGLIVGDGLDVGPDGLASPDRCDPKTRRVGAECRCIQTTYGLSEICNWHGGTPQRLTHHICEAHVSFPFPPPCGTELPREFVAYHLVTSGPYNGPKAQPGDLIERHDFDVACGQAPAGARVIGRPVIQVAHDYDHKKTVDQTLSDALKREVSSCCQQLGLSADRNRCWLDPRR